jgi:large subunit ribosomal protein L53
MSIGSEVVIDVSGLLPKHQFEMITKFITEVSTTFNPFLPRAKTARLFLSFLPPNARQTMKVDTKLLPRASRDPSFIQLKFSKLDLRSRRSFLTAIAEDGKQMKLDAEKLGIKGVVEEVDRHSRILSRQEELNGN